MCWQHLERNRSPSPTPAGGPVAKPAITRSGMGHPLPNARETWLAPQRPIIMWHSPPAFRHTRLRVRRLGIGSAWHALHATKCYVFRLFRDFGKLGFRRKFLLNKWLWLIMSRRSFDDNYRNRMTIKELRHNQERNLSPQKPPFCPLFGAFYPHFATHSTLRAAGASRYPAPKEREWPRSLS